MSGTNVSAAEVTVNAALAARAEAEQAIAAALVEFVDKTGLQPESVTIGRRVDISTFAEPGKRKMLFNVNLMVVL